MYEKEQIWNCRLVGKDDIFNKWCRDGSFPNGKQLKWFLPHIIYENQPQVD